MNLLKTKFRLMHDEGLRLDAYLDTEGVWTIGYGQTRWLNGRPVQQHDVTTPNAAETWLRAELWTCTEDCYEMFPTFPHLTEVRQQVLVNMRYNLGRSGLAAFKNMAEAVRLFDYGWWASEMQDSKWYGQVRNRAERLIHEVRTNEWGPL